MANPQRLLLNSGAIALPVAVDHLPCRHIVAILTDFRRLDFSSGENKLPAVEAAQSLHDRFAARLGFCAAILCVWAIVHPRVIIHREQIRHCIRKRNSQSDESKVEIQIRRRLVYSIDRYYSKLRSRA